jgi:predicted transcriptional regulator
MSTSTTTIRIEDNLKLRIAAAADRAGQTAHAFILEAISQTVERVELDNEFHSLADERWKGVMASGKTVSWDDARAYLDAKSRGENPSKPLARGSNH